MRIAPSLLSVATVTVLLSAPIVADELADTLKKIEGTDTITLGRRDASIPFSYLGTEPGKPIGYFHGLQLEVVEAAKKELSLPDLKVYYNPVTSQTHIPLVQNDTVDVRCSSTTSNEKRQRQVDFSVGILGVGTRLLSKKTANIKDFDDLRDKNVMATVGATSKHLLKAMNADKKMGMNIISAKDHDEFFMMLESGRTVAFMTDDALSYGEMAKAKRSGDWVVDDTPQSFEIYGYMVRESDTAFKRVVGKAIADTYVSSEVNKVCDRRFAQPIPPKGLNLNFPMSEELKKLIASPTDKAVEQT